MAADRAILLKLSQQQELALDFMKLLKSLEELLYELVSWLLFYPLTMWRSVVRPLSMMRYADTELADRPV